MDGTLQAFTLGVLSAASPCLLPLYPGFIAYLGANAGVLAGRTATGIGAWDLSQNWESIAFTLRI
jgi:cytochrome c biogenesis protein CcdA